MEKTLKSIPTDETGIWLLMSDEEYDLLNQKYQEALKKKERRDNVE